MLTTAILGNEFSHSRVPGNLKPLREWIPYPWTVSLSGWPAPSAWVPPNLSYRKHLTKTSGKLKNWNDLMKLAGSTWGASANTLRSSAMALCYSAAEYCTPVWSRSAHTSQINVQLNSTVHLISGTLHSTPLMASSALQHWTASSLQRKAATDKLMEKIVKHDSWPMQPDILSPPLLRLTSRKPLWLDLLCLVAYLFHAHKNSLRKQNTDA